MIVKGADAKLPCVFCGATETRKVYTADHSGVQCAHTVRCNIRQADNLYQKGK